MTPISNKSLCSLAKANTQTISAASNVEVGWSSTQDGNTITGSKEVFQLDSIMVVKKMNQKVNFHIDIHMESEVVLLLLVVTC